MVRACERGLWAQVQIKAIDYFYILDYHVSVKKYRQQGRDVSKIKTLSKCTHS